MIWLCLLRFAFAQDCSTYSCSDCISSTDCNWDVSASTCAAGSLDQDASLCQMTYVTFQTDESLCVGLPESTCISATNCTFEAGQCKGQPVRIAVYGPVDLDVQSPESGDSSENSGAESSATQSADSSTEESTTDASSQNAETSTEEVSTDGSGSSSDTGGVDSATSAESSDEQASSETDAQSGENNGASPSNSDSSTSAETSGDSSSAVEGAFCTADVITCPDGSMKSRNPNNDCEFDECPASTVSASSTSRPGIRVLIADCEMMRTRETCSGMHEGKQCMWDAYDRKCVESEVGDPDHICRQYINPAECNGNHLCSYDNAERKCVQFSDSPVPVLPRPVPGNPTNGFPSRPVPGIPANGFPNRLPPSTSTTSGSSNSAPPPFPPHGLAMDCEYFRSPTTCSGKFHEGKTCLWSVEKNSCIESEPGDLEHICGQYATPGPCRAEVGCLWGPENKCEQASEYGIVTPPRPSTPISPSGGRPPLPTNPSSSSSNPRPNFGGSGSSGSASSNPRPIFGGPTSGSRPVFPPIPGLTGDCEIYRSPSSCMGKFHEGSQCYWKAEKRECIAGEIGDLDHICAQFGSPAQCQGHPGCSYDSNERKCVQFGDAGGSPPFFPRPPSGSFPRPNGGFPGPSSNPGGFSGPSTNNGGSSSSQSNPTFNNPSGSSNGPVYPPMPGSFMSGGDCETYLTRNACTGKRHDQAQCYWNAERRECVEGEIGDLEHICGQFSIPSNCQQAPGCAWDLHEMRCSEWNDVEVQAPPGFMNMRGVRSGGQSAPSSADSSSSSNSESSSTSTSGTSSSSSTSSSSQSQMEQCRSFQSPRSCISGGCYWTPDNSCVSSGYRLKSSHSLPPLSRVHPNQIKQDNGSHFNFLLLGMIIPSMLFGMGIGVFLYKKFDVISSIENKYLNMDELKQ